MPIESAFTNNKSLSVWYIPQYIYIKIYKQYNTFKYKFPYVYEYYYIWLGLALENTARVISAITLAIII